MIKIMVDSASDCRDEEIYDIFVPLVVNMNGTEYLDGVSLDNDTFYGLLTETTEFPRTSQPSPADFVDYFEKVKEAGDEVIYFAISSALSGTYQSANLAKSMVEYEHIYIIDTKSATHAIGMMAGYAKELVKQGICASEIVERCEQMKEKVRIYAGLDTLEYLQRGGRIGKAAALVGSLANLKPIVTVSKEGVVDAVGKALGVNRAMQTIVDKVKNFNIDTGFPICSLYTYGEENTEKLEKRMEAEDYSIAKRLQIGSTIGAHVGPGVYGIVFVSR